MIDHSRILSEEDTRKGAKTEKMKGPRQDSISSPEMRKTQQAILRQLPGQAAHGESLLNQQISLMLHGLADAIEQDGVSSAHDLANAALQGVQRIVDCSRPLAKEDTFTQARDPRSFSQEANDGISPQKVNGVLQARATENDEFCGLGSSSLLHYSKVYGSNKAQYVKQESNNAKWEEDLTTFVHATVPDRDFWPEDKGTAMRGYEVAPPDDYNSAALGNLFHACVDQDAESHAEARFRTRSEYLKWSGVARRPDMPIYVLPHLRGIRILTRDQGNSLASHLMIADDIRFRKDPLVDPLLAENPFGHDPGGANGWSGGEYGSDFAMTPGRLFRPEITFLRFTFCLRGVEQK